MSRTHWFGMIAASITIAACGDGSGPQARPRLRLTPAWVSIEIGDSITGDTVRAAFSNAAGVTVRADSVAWTSSDTTVATVTATGLVRARRTGTTTIRGTVGADVASQRLTVTDPVLVGAGDMGACSSTNDEATAVLLDSIAGTVFTAGDNDYSDVTPAPAYGVCFAASWGRHKWRVRPAAGDDDKRNNVLADYFAYFGPVAHGPTGYYSFDLGTWHVVVLNSAFAVDTAQVNWLRTDLAAHPALCTVAVSHRPRFSSGNTGNSSGQAALFQTLVDGGAEVLLSGNDHDYERFGPQRADQTPDPDSGLVQLVVGTGGKSHGRINLPLVVNSVTQNDDTYGVLRLELHATGYSWRFVPVRGKTFSDSGTGVCH